MVLSQKKIAAKILKCGVSRVWIDPNNTDKVKRAITRRDIRNLIKNNLIKKLPEKKRKKKLKKRKGPGSRKGTLATRIGKKGLWLKTIRPQRKLLRELKHSGRIEQSVYRKMYRMVKGGNFRNKQHLLSYLKEHGFLKKHEG